MTVIKKAEPAAIFSALKPAASSARPPKNDATSEAAARSVPLRARSSSSTRSCCPSPRRDRSKVKSASVCVTCPIVAEPQDGLSGIGPAGTALLEDRARAFLPLGAGAQARRDSRELLAFAGCLTSKPLRGARRLGPRLEHLAGDPIDSFV